MLIAHHLLGLTVCCLLQDKGQFLLVVLVAFVSIVEDPTVDAYDIYVIIIKKMLGFAPKRWFSHFTRSRVCPNL